MEKYIPKDGYMGFVEDGREYEYNECCIEMFDKLMKHGVSPAIIMDWLFGEDSCQTHIRCPKCRDKHKLPLSLFPTGKYIKRRKDLKLLIRRIKFDLILIKQFNLLPISQRP